MRITTSSTANETPSRKASQQQQEESSTDDLDDDVSYKKKTFTKVLSEFCHETTAHGVSHAANADTPPWRVFWTIITLICLMFMSYQIYTVVQEYRDFGKAVNLELKFEITPFPAVTICNINPYKRSRLNQVPELASIIAEYDRAIEETLEEEFAKSRNGHRWRRDADEEATLDGTRPSIEPLRFIAVSAPCVCKIDKLNGQREEGSCLPSHKGTVLTDISTATTGAQFQYLQARCVCILDRISYTPWPCFPSKSSYL